MAALRLGSTEFPASGLFIRWAFLTVPSAAQILAVSAVAGSQSTNVLNVYKVPKAGSTATLMDGPLVIPSGTFGAPGGNGAVVDKYGFLWTGSGPFLYGAAGTYSVLRFDTRITSANDAAKPILAFQMADEANVRTTHNCLQPFSAPPLVELIPMLPRRLAAGRPACLGALGCVGKATEPVPDAASAMLQMLMLDSDSNLWVAGAGHVTKVFTDATAITAASGTISATLAGSAISGGIVLSTSSVSAPIALNLAADSTLIAACSGHAADGCCTAGSFDAGIAITRDVVASGASFQPSDINTIYVANTCDTGLVRALADPVTSVLKPQLYLSAGSGSAIDCTEG